TLPSRSYLRIPAAAIFQNSLALLVTNASFTGFCGLEPVPFSRVRQAPSRTVKQAARNQSGTKVRGLGSMVTSVHYISGVGDEPARRRCLLQRCRTLPECANREERGTWIDTTHCRSCAARAVL